MGGNSFNPLVFILKENKLTGPNYIDWKRNLNLVLTAQEYKSVLTNIASSNLIQEMSRILAAKRSQDQQQAFGRHTR